MRYNTPVIFILFLTLHSFSQQLWEWSNPWPVGTVILSMAWTGEKIVAVGRCGTIMTSSDGIQWKVQKPVVKTHIAAVHWTGSSLIAVGENSVVLMSKDGENWSVGYCDVSGSAWLTDVDWTGTQYVCTGIGGVIVTSPDGKLWTKQDTKTTVDLLGLVWTGKQLVACGANGTFLISADGLNWTKNIVAGGTPRYTDIVWDGTKFVAVAHMAPIIKSYDGKDWTGCETPVYKNFETIAWGGNRFVVAGGDTILTSSDGINWEVAPYITSETQCAVWAGNQFVLGEYCGRIYTSPDGLAWTYRGKSLGGYGSGAYYRAITWGKDRFVVVSTDTSYVSFDAIHWEKYYTGRTIQIEQLWDITWTGKQFIAVGGLGWPVILGSADGMKWDSLWGGEEALSRDKGADLLSVTFSPDRVIACGRGGYVVYSKDLRTWTKVQLTNTYLLGIAWTGKGYITVGAEGKIFTSPDGETWTQQNSGTKNGFYDIAWNGSKLVAVGVYNTIMSSVDMGITWQPEQSNIPGNVSWTGVLWAGDRFVAVTSNGLAIMSYDGIHWVDTWPGTEYWIEDIAANDSLIVVVGDFQAIIRTKKTSLNTSIIKHYGNAAANTIVFSVKGNFIRLLLPEAKNANFRLFDIRGRVVASLCNLSEQNIIDLSRYNLSNGQYIISVEQGTKVYSSKFSLIQ